MQEKKISALALLRILEENSDEEHPLTQPQLLNLVDTIYHITLDRRTLYSNIEMLQEFGYDIATYSETGRGYYLRKRQFEPSQIYLLCNAIHASNFIPQKSSKELIDKLLSTQSRYFKEDFRSTVFVENNKKKENKEFFLNIELLAEAIREKKSVSFSYMKYDTNKQLVDRRSEPYVFSPYYLVCNLDKTYMIGKSKNHNELTHFRVDRMKRLKKVDEPYIKLNKKEDPYEYARNKIYMYKGNEERIVIKCDMNILDDVIDTFGKDIRIIANGDNFVAHVKSAKEGMVYFALQYAKHLEVLKPTDLRAEITDVLKQALKNYK